MPCINDLKSYATYDNRGKPRLSIELFLDNGACGKASIPLSSDYPLKATTSVIKDGLFPHLLGRDGSCQNDFDDLLCDIDGTREGFHFGKDVLRAFSFANAQAYAKSHKLPLHHYLGGCAPIILPVPCVTFPSKQERIQKEELDFSVSLLPIGACNFLQAVQWEHSLSQKLEKYLLEKTFPKTVAEALMLFDRMLISFNLRSGIDVVFLVEENTNNSPGGSKPTEYFTCSKHSQSNFHYFSLTSKATNEGKDATKRPEDFSVIVPEAYKNVSDILRGLSIARKKALNTLLSPAPYVMADNFLGDLAIAGQFQIIRLASLLGASDVACYNRLLEIEQNNKTAYAGQSIVLPSLYNQ